MASEGAKHPIMFSKLQNKIRKQLVLSSGQARLVSLKLFFLLEIGTLYSDKGPFRKKIKI
jgi:hypothetical protein